MSISAVGTPRLDLDRVTTKSRVVAPQGSGSISSYPTDTYTPSTHPNEIALMDTVHISSTAASGTDVREDKVEQIRAQITKGTYAVPASALADALIRKGVFKRNVPQS